MSQVVRLSTLLLIIVLVLPMVLTTVTTGDVQATIICTPGTIYVNASRPNDDGPGTSWATAFKKIQSGIDNACTGSTVYVAAGTYNENLYVDKNLILIGAGALDTIIDGGFKGQVICIASYIGQTNTISGFTIQNGHIGWPTNYKEEGTLQGAVPGMPVGGGVYVAYGHAVTLNDCTVKNNTADFMGGGIYNAGEIILNRCTISGNSAAQVGGGIANFMDVPRLGENGAIVVHGTMVLTNCTISGNSVKPLDGYATAKLAGPAVLYGGGLYNGGTADLLNVTIADNSVNSDTVSKGGGFANVPLQCNNDMVTIVNTDAATVATFKNTLVTNNIPDNGYNGEEAEVTSLGYNLDSQNNCLFDQHTDQINTNPQLGQLQNNGGPTSTHAITTSSPAFDRGTGGGAPATDQRGITRPQAGGYDIGAYECVPPPPPPLAPEPNPLIHTGQSSVPGLAIGTYSYNPPVSLPIIQTSSASLSAKIVTPGTPVTVTADIINKSTINGNKKVTLYVNGQVESTQGVTVNSGSSSKLTFNVTRSEPGEYNVYVDGVPAGSFKVEMVTGNDGILIFSIALTALAFVFAMVMLWRRQRAV